MIADRKLPVLQLESQSMEKMRLHIQRCLPEEACGFLGGMDEKITCVLPVENELHSPTRYRMQPKEQIRAMMVIESSGLELLGIFHSHPMGPETPSESDLEQAAYPGVLHLIWTPVSGEWRCRAFLLEEGLAVEVPIEMDDQG